MKRKWLAPGDEAKHKEESGAWWKDRLSALTGRIHRRSVVSVVRGLGEDAGSKASTHKEQM